MQLRFGKIEPHASAVLGPDITDGTAYSGIPEIDVLGMSTKKKRNRRSWNNYLEDIFSYLLVR